MFLQMTKKKVKRTHQTTCEYFFHLLKSVVLSIIYFLSFLVSRFSLLASRFSLLASPLPACSRFRFPIPLASCVSGPCISDPDPALREQQQAISNATSRIQNMQNAKWLFAFAFASAPSPGRAAARSWGP
jgi:hypothetical protein